MQNDKKAILRFVRMYWNLQMHKSRKCLKKMPIILFICVRFGINALLNVPREI